MVADPLILLQPRCPDPEDPEIRELLRLLAGLCGAAWAQLELEPGPCEPCRIYCYGEPTGPANCVELEGGGRFSGVLTVGTDAPLSLTVGKLANFALTKVLQVRRLREQAGLLRGALDATTSSILLFDKAGNIVYSNAPADDLLSLQTEGGLLILRDGEPDQPLFTVLCLLVEKVVASAETRSSWSGTLALSDGSRIAGEILRVRIKDRDERVGVLVQLTPVGPLAERYLGVFALDHHLSPREEEVLGLIHEGLATAEIAQRLGISPHTVRDHVKNLYRKTGANSRSEVLCKLTLGESM